jgi:hypothetical protein
VLDVGAIDCAFTPGSQYDIVTIDHPRDAAPTAVMSEEAPLAEVADDDALAACADGCWRYDAASRRLRIRLVTTRSVYFD